MAPVVLALRTRLAPLDELLAGQGLAVHHAPAARLVPCDGPPPALRAGEVLLVTSAATVRLCPSLPGVIAAAAGVEVWAVGPATAAALRGAGIAPDRIGDAGGAALIEQLGERPATFVGAVHPAADTAAAIASGRLRHWKVYDREAVPELARRIAAGPALSAVVLTSPAQVRALAAVAGRDGLPDLLGGLPVACIGPTTAAAARAAGAPDPRTPDRPGLSQLAELVARLVDRG